MNLTRRDLLKSTTAMAAATLAGPAAFAADKEGTLKVASFGGDAQTVAINHAIERYRDAGSERINTYLGSLAAERERA